ncbi:MAG: hypothetical protein KGJ82_13915 [Nitrospirota bacterium]|nr:hypothetical protein [Nitrospirota bacterium]MDE3050720.1 hypothetical protein [Nitrospirota bacterium]MDE3219548.1 hypothetical protein [Nitrospirota bacterium]
MKSPAGDDAQADPVSLSDMHEDPAHLAGRLEEYETVSQQAPVNLTYFDELELKDKFQGVLKEIVARRPQLLKYCFNQVTTALNPRWSEKLYEARLERMFEDEPELTPSTATMRLLGTIRMPETMKPFILVKAQRVKRRLLQRRLDQEKRDFRHGGM